MVNPVRNRKIHTRNTRFLVISAAEAESLEFIEPEPEEAARPHDNTGVDHEDLQEHHLQVALNAAQKSAHNGKTIKKAFIPTPDASRQIDNYDALYQKKWHEPTSLIRFSATVEESIGCSYSMDDDDEVWLRKFNNSRRSKDGPLSEISFEKIMSNFDDTTNERQPYLSTDPTVIAPFEEFEPTFEYLSLKALLPYAQHVYQHWRERRLKRQGKPIAPSLKFEENEKEDSNDPYICFRRREVRQVRKTRRQDAVSTERIRRLKAEMQQARDLVTMVSAREKCREEALKAEKALFDIRVKVKAVKRKFGILGGDEDLFPVKKKKPAPDLSLQNGRIPTRPDGLISGPLRILPLSEYRKGMEANRTANVERKLSRKMGPNLGWMDRTEEEYFGVYTDGYRCFRNLITTEEPTYIETDADSVFSAANPVSSVSSAGSTSSGRTVSRYRQRYGRGGRVWVDRTLTASEKEDLEKYQTSSHLNGPILEERWKYDPRASEDEKPVPLDEYDIQQVVYRSRLLPPPSPRVPVGMGPPIRLNPNMLSTQLMRPQINSPSFPRPSLPFQTPK